MIILKIFSLVLLSSVFFMSSSFAYEQEYTCGKIKREENEVDMSCLKNPKPDVQFKSEIMMRKLLDHVSQLEEKLGEKQLVFFVARAGNSLKGFTQLRSHDKNDQAISLDQVFDYGKSLFPSSLPKSKYFDQGAYEEWNQNQIFQKPFYNMMYGIQRKIIKKYVDKKRPKLNYSHAALMFWTDKGWNILHELMPCNEKQKAYTFREPTTPMYSRFFLDKPSEYKALVIPLDQELQKRIYSIITNKEYLMNRSPVYRAMANPWQVNDHNSNSFILEIIESAMQPLAKHEAMVNHFNAQQQEYIDHLESKKSNGKDLSVKQKERIEKYDQGYKKVCRYDVETRKMLLSSYIKRGFQPSKVVLDGSWKGGHIGNKIKMSFISVPFLPDHIQPDLEVYGDHLAMGIGEAVTVDSLWNYIERIKVTHPQADPADFEVPRLSYEDALEYADAVRQDIYFKGKEVDGRFHLLSRNERSKEREKFEDVLADMNPKKKSRHQQAFGRNR